MNYERNRRYYYPRPLSTCILLIAVGVLIAMLGRDFDATFSLAVGGVVFLIGIWRLIVDYRGRVGDGEIDAQMALALGDVRRDAMARFALAEEDLERETISFEGYYFHVSAPIPLVAFGKDKKARANICEAAALLFGRDNLYWYDHKSSLVFDEEDKIVAEAVPYGEIADVWAENIRVSCQNNKKKAVDLPCETFSLELKDGRRFTICLAGQKGRAKTAALAVDKAMLDRNL